MMRKRVIQDPVTGKTREVLIDRGPAKGVELRGINLAVHTLNGHVATSDNHGRMRGRDAA